MDFKKLLRKPKHERRDAIKLFNYEAQSSYSSSFNSSSSVYTCSTDLNDRTSFRIDGIDGEFDQICRSLGLYGPKHERRDAIKLFNYEAQSSYSSSFNSSSSVYTCSTDLNDRTSFRIDRIDGEFDKICRSLGLYGPEDFAIPAAAWEAKKFRSSSDIGRLRYSRCCMSEKCQDRDRDEVAETVVIGGAGGINGIRPPMIKPPPLMRVWVVDNSESLQRRREKAGSGSGGDAAGAGDNSVSSEEGELVISPNQRIKPGCWQKGVLLWRGSFASVYEGCTDNISTCLWHSEFACL